MSTATVRRNRDERVGEGADKGVKTLDKDSNDKAIRAKQYQAYLPGVAAEPGTEPTDNPASVDAHGRNAEDYELVVGAGSASGASPVAAEREADEGAEAE